MKIIQLILFLLTLAALPAQAAVNRTIRINAPDEATAGSTVSVSVGASTEATDGEQIGFLHSEYSIDEGKTWILCYNAENSGKKLSREVSFAVDARGGMAIVRARVAFRGGVAGDVDYKGGAIRWDESWQKWRSPPAKYAVIKVPKLPAAVPATRPPTVSRSIDIEAPTEAAAGSTVSVTVHASTKAGDGEQIGFMHAEYSIDGGKTWLAICYAEKSGAELSRKVSFAVNPKGGKAIVRVKVAFRGGADGDVDYTGSAIQWDSSWPKWLSPATKYAIIYSPKPKS